MELKPINWKILWLVYGCTMLLVYASIPATIIWLYFNSEKSIEEVQQCNKDMHGGDSVIDLLSFLFLFILGGLLATVVQYGNFKMRDALCDLSFQLDLISSHESPLVSFLIVSVLFVPPMICNSFVFGWNLVECLNINWIKVVPPLFSFSNVGGRRTHQ